jgi:ubiquitin-protein ligase
MSTKSGNRIHKELDMLHKRPIKGVNVLPVGDDLHTLESIIHGPDESVYKGGMFKVQVLLTYPSQLQ